MYYLLYFHLSSLLLALFNFSLLNFTQQELCHAARFQTSSLTVMSFPKERDTGSVPQSQNFIEKGTVWSRLSALPFALSGHFRGSAVFSWYMKYLLQSMFLIYLKPTKTAACYQKSCQSQLLLYSKIFSVCTNLPNFFFCPVLEIQNADGCRFRPPGSLHSQAHRGTQIRRQNFQILTKNVFFLNSRSSLVKWAEITLDQQSPVLPPEEFHCKEKTNSERTNYF